MLKKWILTFLCACLLFSESAMQPAYAAQNELEDPLPAPDEQNENTAEQKAACASEGYTCASALLTEPEDSSDIIANLKSYPITLEHSSSTNFSPADWTYSAATPKVISFFDSMDFYNVAYINTDTAKLQIQRYDSQMQLNDQLEITASYPLFGNITCDASGYYYVIWGQADTEETNCVTMCVSKYDYDGKLIAECTLNGYDTYPYSGSSWGTKTPFRSANCSVVINNGILACHYGRTMYSGHQSNFVIYIDCDTMTRITPKNVPYCSHSFDQRIIALENGVFLTASHGDAYSRGFEVAVVESLSSYCDEITTFHFREGSNRSYGYNETYAQLGGIAETTNGFVLCGSSERTLSLANAPTNQSYCGHSEARDLFIQILKKDFYNYSNAEIYLVEGETRYAVDEHSEESLSKLFLSEDVVDYGILWLTSYEEDYYAANPKVIATEDDKIVVLWEKLSYATHTGTTYFTVLNEDGTVYQDALEIRDTRLAGNIDPIYRNGKIYWTTNNTNGSYIHELTVIGQKDLNNIPPEKPYKIVNIVSGVHLYWNTVENAQKYGVWRSETGIDGTYKWLANPTVPHFIDTSAESGKTYYYKITALNAKTNKHSDKSEAIGITYVDTPDLTLRVNRTGGIGLGWNKIEGATGYAIYRKSYSGTDNWVRIATITNPNTLTWNDTSVRTENGTIYRYTIRALAGTNRTTLSGCRSNGRTMARLTTRNLSSVVSSGANSVKCSWTTTVQASGYEIRFMKGSTIYKTYDITNYKTGTKTFYELEAGTTYKVQVRSYKTVTGIGTFYSAWSEAKYVTTDAE